MVDRTYHIMHSSLDSMKSELNRAYYFLSLNTLLYKVRNELYYSNLFVHKSLKHNTVANYSSDNYFLLQEIRFQ